MKSVTQIISPPPKHWVGNGFHVHGMFSYNGAVQRFSPFLMLDYASPEPFAPLPAGGKPRGVGSHPHRGFETVTIAYQGEVAHRDSAGHGGTIGTGDVQWMTAGSGVVHEEFHSAAWGAQGGTFEMVQLWVNLPAKDKMTTPKYQGISAAQIPTVALPNGAGTLRAIAGNYRADASVEMSAEVEAGADDTAEIQGAASTFSPLCLWDIQLHAGSAVRLPVPAGWNCSVLVRSGQLDLDDGRSAQASQLVVFDAAGSQVALKSHAGAELLLMAGQPLNEPVVGYGPFVMNTREEIVQAVDDFNSGKFGQI